MERYNRTNREKSKHQRDIDIDCDIFMRFVESYGYSDIDTHIKLCDGINMEELRTFGFKQYGNTFIYKACLYKSIIEIKVTITLNNNGDNRDVYFEVYDVYKHCPYSRIFYNPNGFNDMVAMKCINEFNSLINDLIKKRILMFVGTL